MNTRVMVIIAVSILAACSNRKSNQVLTLTLKKEATKAFVDKINAAELTPWTRLFTLPPPEQSYKLPDFR